MFTLQPFTCQLITIFLLYGFGSNIFVGSIEYRKAGNRTGRTFQGLPAFLAGFRLGQGAYIAGLSESPNLFIPMTKLYNALPYPYSPSFWYPHMWPSLGLPAQSLHPVNQQQIIHLKEPLPSFTVEENYQESQDNIKQTIENTLQQKHKQNIVESSHNILETNNESGEQIQDRIITTLSRLLEKPFRNLNDDPIATSMDKTLVTTDINNTHSNLIKVAEILANKSNTTEPTSAAETTVDVSTQESRNSTTETPNITSPPVVVVGTNDTVMETNKTYEGFPSYYGGNPWVNTVTFTTIKPQQADQMQNYSLLFRTDPGIGSFLTMLIPPLENKDEHQFLKPTTNSNFYPMDPNRFSIFWTREFENNIIGA